MKGQDVEQVVSVPGDPPHFPTADARLISCVATVAFMSQKQTKKTNLSFSSGPLAFSFFKLVSWINLEEPVPASFSNWRDEKILFPKYFLCKSNWVTFLSSIKTELKTKFLNKVTVLVFFVFFESQNPQQRRVFVPSLTFFPPTFHWKQQQQLRRLDRSRTAISSRCKVPACGGAGCLAGCCNDRVINDGYYWGEKNCSKRLQIHIYICIYIFFFLSLSGDFWVC